MKCSSFTAKTLEEALEEAKTSLNLTDEDFVYSYEETKGKLFKAGSFNVSVYTLTDICSYLKDYLKKLTSDMGIEVNFESKIREKTIEIKMISDNNPILIGRNGQTLKALECILMQVVSKETSKHVRVALDVEGYKEKQIKRLERLAINLAKDCVRTKTDVHMEAMNAYERRIVHNKLTDFKGVKTESIGEEPNRHLVIKYVK